VLLLPGSILAAAWTLAVLEYPDEGLRIYGTIAGFLPILFAALGVWRPRALFAFLFAGASLLSFPLALLLAFCADYMTNCGLAESLSGWVLWVGLLGGLAGVVVGFTMILTRLPTPPPTGTAVCRNCGAALYAQWWSEADGGYKCRRCGEINPRSEAVAPEG
jgi:hypothetical protein